MDEDEVEDIDAPSWDALVATKSVTSSRQKSTNSMLRTSLVSPKSYRQQGPTDGKSPPSTTTTARKNTQSSDDLELITLRKQLNEYIEKCNQLQKELTEANMKIRMAANREAEFNASRRIERTECDDVKKRVKFDASVMAEIKSLETIKRERNEYRALAEERLGIIQRYEQMIKDLEASAVLCNGFGRIHHHERNQHSYANVLQRSDNHYDVRGKIVGNEHSLTSQIDDHRVLDLESDSLHVVEGRLQSFISLYHMTVQSLQNCTSELFSVKEQRDHFKAMHEACVHQLQSLKTVLHTKSIEILAYSQDIDRSTTEKVKLQNKCLELEERLDVLEAVNAATMDILRSREQQMVHLFEGYNESNETVTENNNNNNMKCDMTRCMCKRKLRWQREELAGLLRAQWESEKTIIELKRIITTQQHNIILLHEARNSLRETLQQQRDYFRNECRNTRKMLKDLQQEHQQTLSFLEAYGNGSDGLKNKVRKEVKREDVQCEYEML